MKAGYVYRGELFPTEAGTPQGGVISATLANMTLDGMSEALEERFGRPTQRCAWKNKVHLVRYADDFVVTAASEDVAQEVISRFLRVRGLALSEEKTCVTRIDDGFDFLGWNFRKYAGKLLIRPSRRSVKAVKEKLHDIILRKDVSATQTDLIRELNPVITGWANYHRCFCAAKTFNEIDNTVFLMLRRWANCRHHSNKSRGWITERYWRSVGKRKWVFASKELRLKRMSDVRIVRHKMLRRDANPYLEASYFEKRPMPTDTGLRRSGELLSART